MLARPIIYHRTGTVHRPREPELADAARHRCPVECPSAVRRRRARICSTGWRSGRPRCGRRGRARRSASCRRDPAVKISRRCQRPFPELSMPESRAEAVPGDQKTTMSSPATVVVTTRCWARVVKDTAQARCRARPPPPARRPAAWGHSSPRNRNGWLPGRS